MRPYTLSSEKLLEIVDTTWDLKSAGIKETADHRINNYANLTTLHPSESRVTTRLKFWRGHSD